MLLKIEATQCGRLLHCSLRVEWTSIETFEKLKTLYRPVDDHTFCASFVLWLLTRFDVNCVGHVWKVQAKEM